MCHPVSLSFSNRDELLTSRKRMISRQHPPSDGKSHRAAAPIFLFFDWLYRLALIAVVSFSICPITFFICHHSHSQPRQWQMKNVIWQTENASRHDFELVADFERSARDRARRQLDHAARGEPRRCHTERAHVFHQFDYSQLLIQKDHVNREKHPKGVDAIARAQPDRFGLSEAAAKHQTAQTLEKRVGERDLFGKTLPGRAMINLHCA